VFTEFTHASKPLPGVLENRGTEESILRAQGILSKELLIRFLGSREH